jgi:hypothetical protein
MFARVTVVDGLGDQWDKAKELLTTHAVPRTRELRGCCASYWLGDPRRGRSWRLPCTSPRRSFGQAPTRSRP